MAKVKIYKDGSYLGSFQELGVGRHNWLLIGNDELSSIDIPAGWKATLWWDRNFSGESLVLTSSTSYVGSHWNDETTAIAVNCPASAAPLGTPGSLTLLGGGAYVDLGATGTHTASGQFDGFTVEAWVYFDQIGNYARIVELFQTAGTDNIVLCREGTTSNLYFGLRKAGVVKSMTAQGVIRNGQWMHFAATIDAQGVGRIYVDGKTQPEWAAQLAVPDNVVRSTGYLGKSSYSQDPMFVGQVCEFRLWNVERSAAEIARMMSGRLTGTERGLVRYLRCDETSGTTLVDCAGVRNAQIVNAGSVLFGMAGPTLRDAISLPTAMQLDGSRDYLTLPPFDMNFAQPFTIEAWVYHSDLRAWTSLFDLGNGQGTGVAADDILIGRDGSTSDLLVRVYRGSALELSLKAPGFLAQQTWQHFALTMSAAAADGTALFSIYRNGVLVTSSRGKAPNNVPRTKCYVGKCNWDPTIFLKGRFAEVRFWSVARSQDEILAGMYARLDAESLNLFAYYPLDEQSGTQAQDVTPRHLHAATAALVSWNQSPPPALVPLRPPSHALLLNGTDVYVELPALTDDFSSGFTLEAWAMFDETGSSARLFDLGAGQGVDNIILSREGTTSDLSVQIYGNTWGGLRATGVIQNGCWMHVAVSVAGGTGSATLYVNGTARASGVLPLPRSGVSRTKSYLGKSNWAGNPLLKGRLADVRIWSVARSAAEIASAMNRELVGTETGLLRYFPLDEGSGNACFDKKRPGVVGASAKLFGQAQRLVAVPPETTHGCIVLDGAGDYVELPACEIASAEGITLSAWVYFDGIRADERILELSNGPAADSIILSRASARQAIALELSQQGITARIETPAGVISSQAWVHIAASIDAVGNANLYINGSGVASGKLLVPRSGIIRSQCYIGHSSSGGQFDLKGRVCDVHAWNCVRSASELAAQMKTPITGKEPRLLFAYPLHERSGVGLANVVHTDGVASGGATWASLPHKTVLDFDGSGTYVKLPSIADDLSKGFTIEAWVRFTGTQSWARIFDLGVGQATDNILLARGSTSNDLVLHLYRGTTYGELRAPDAIPLGQWFHVAVTFDSLSEDGTGLAHLFVNGIEQVSARINSPRSGVVRNSCFLGKSNWSVDRLFRGQMSEARIFATGRTASEISAFARRPLVGTETGLCRLYRLDGASSSQALDFGPQAKHGQLFSPVTRQALSFAGRSGLPFNGASDFVSLLPLADDFSRGFSITAWVRFARNDAWARIVDFGNGQESDNIYLSRYSNTNQISLSVRSGSVPMALITDAVIPTDGSWFHVAATVYTLFGKGVASIYVNGAAVAMRTDMTLPRGGIIRSQAYLGKSNWAVDPLLCGHLADVAVFTRPLSAQEVAAIKAGGLVGTESGLAHLYRLYDCRGSIVPDSSSVSPQAGLLFGTQADESAWRPDARALALAGGLSAVELPTQAFDLRPGFTLEAWIFCEGTPTADEAIVSFESEEANRSVMLCRLAPSPAGSASKDLMLLVATDNGWCSAICPAIALKETWCHVGVSVSAASPSGGPSTASFYVCGHPAVRVPLTPDSARQIQTENASWIGCGGSGLSPFQGRLAELRLWNRELTASEILSRSHVRLAGNELGLIRYYPLSESVGKTVRDGLARSSALRRGNPIQITKALPYSQPDFAARALALDGVSQAVALPQLAADLSRGFTFESWIYFDGANTDVAIFELGRGDGTDSVSLTKTGTSDLTLKVYQADLGRTLTAGGVLRDREYQHIASTVDASGIAVIYVDGVERARGSLHSLRSGVLRPKSFLGATSADSPHLLGRLSEVRLWNRARSASEIGESRGRSLLDSDPSLLAYYRCTETDGVILHDSSYHARDASLLGLRQIWGSPAPLFLPPPQNSGALALDGIGDWVELRPIASDLSLGFCLEAWIFAEDARTWASVFDLGNEAQLDNVVLGRRGTDSALVLEVYRGSIKTTLATSPNSLNANVWTHVAATMDGSGNGKLYIQGQLQASSPVSIPTAAVTRRAFVGRSSQGPQANFCGQICEARIWSVARAEADIRKTIATRLRGTEPGLVVNHRLNETEGERAGDSSKAVAHGWARGKCSWIAATAPNGESLPSFSQPAIPQAALCFDGTVYVSIPALFSDVVQTAATGLCLEAYVYCNDVTKTASFVDLGTGTSGADNVYLGQAGTTLVFGVQVGTAAIQVVNAVGALAGSRWTHVAASVDENGHVLLCKDGVPLTIDRNVITPLTNAARSQCYVGRNQSGALFSGRITEARIWSQSRTPKQILASMSGRLAGAVAGLLRCYPLLGVVGTRSEDSTNFHQDGRVVGSVIAWNQATPDLLGVATAASANPVSGALSFDGASTYVRVPTVSEDLGKGFTLEAWVCFESVGSWSRILDIGQGMRQNNVYLSRYGTTDRVAMRIYYDGASYTEFVTNASVISLSTWIHIAATMDATGNVRIYINGTSATLNTSSVVKLPTLVPRDRAFIGKSNWYWDAMFKGKMAEVRIWNRARSAEEISAGRTMRMSGSEPGLLGCYRLDESQGVLVADRSARKRDARGAGDLGWGSVAPVLSAPPPAVLPTRPLDVQPPTAMLTTPQATTTWGTGISTGTALVDMSLNTYVSSGIAFDIFGVPAALKLGGTIKFAPLAQTVAVTGTLEMTKPVSLPAVSGTLVIDKTASPVLFWARFSTAYSVAQLVHDAAAQSPAGVLAVVDALVVPPLQGFSNSTIIVASGDGYDPELGEFGKGINLYATQKVSDLPGINLLPDKWKIDLLHLNERFLVLAVGIRSATEYRFSGRAILNIPLIPGNQVSLTFNELGLNSSVGPGKSSFAIAHRFTLKLFGESLVFQGQIGVEKGSTGEDIVVWGSLDPDENQYPDGKWHNPFGCPGIVIDGLGVQLKLADRPPFLGVGLRGGVHIGDGLLGASIALNFDPANVDQTILALESPEGIDLPRLIRAVLNVTGIPGLSALLPILDVSIKDLVLYFAPNGGSIAGKDYDAGISLGGSLDLWGYQARLFGCLSVTSGGVLTGQADRIFIEVGGVTLISFSNVQGSGGPSIDVALTASRQGIFYSGKLVLLNGLYDNYQELSISREGLSFLCPTDMGALELHCKRDEFFLSVAPRFRYGFSVLGLSVSVDIGGRIANTVDSGGYSQELSFWFHVCGVDVSVGPVQWGVALTDLKSIAGVFEHFFADTVKSFFTNQLGKALKAAFDWVKNNLIDIAEEAVELFKSAGAAIADIAKNVYEVFDVGAQELIGYLGTGINEAASILKDALAFAAAEAAEVLGAAFGATADTVKSALAGVGYAAEAIDGIASEVWNTIDDAAGYLDPTSW